MLDNKKFPLSLVMIQPPAMPGSYKNNGKDLEAIEKYVYEEAEMIYKQGFDDSYSKTCMTVQ